jgi:ABC-2 type transport system permease protein
MRLVKGDADFLETELVEKRVSALVEVPQGFGRAVASGAEGALQTTFMDDYENRVFLQSYLEGYTASLVVLTAAAGGDETRLEHLLADTREQATDVSSLPLEGDVAERIKDRHLFRVTMGFFLRIGALLTIGMASILFDDRENGTWQRVRASSVTAPSYVTGVCAAGFVAVVLMVALFFCYLALIGAGNNLLLGQMLVPSLLSGLFAVAFALVCGLLLTSRNSIYFVVISVSTISCLIGGAYFPIDTAPQLMQQLAHVSPAFWYISALEGLYAGDTTAWLSSTGVLALFSLLCFLIAGVSYASKRATVG